MTRNFYLLTQVLRLLNTKGNKWKPSHMCIHVPARVHTLHCSSTLWIILPGHQPSLNQPRESFPSYHFNQCQSISVPWDRSCWATTEEKSQSISGLRRQQIGSKTRDRFFHGLCIHLLTASGLQSFPVIAKRWIYAVGVRQEQRASVALASFHSL